MTALIVWTVLLGVEIVIYLFISAILAIPGEKIKFEHSSSYFFWTSISNILLVLSMWFWM